MGPRKYINIKSFLEECSINKVFKVIWNEARNAYVVVSEIAKNRGSKSCSTKKLLAMLIATGVMTCASFDVLAAQPTAAETAKFQYVAFGDATAGLTDGREKTIDGHKYIYDAANKYWVRKGYKPTVEKNGKLHTPLSANGKAADVAYIGGGDTGSILQSVTSMVSASGTVTNMGESLNRITASAFAGVSHGGGTAVDGTWDYIIQDSSWKGYVANGNFKDGYVDLIDKDNGMPKGFVTADDPNTELNWDDTKQSYTYKGKPVDYSNVYVIDGKIGVFTNKDGSDFYKGTVFGKNNEILMTVKDADNHFYSYWASKVTDPSATMQSYRLVEYKKDLAALVENDKMLNRNDIKEVTMTTDANSAIIGLLRNGDTEAGAPVQGAITVTSGGGTGGSGADHDTFVKISNGTVNQTFATGSKVEVNGPANAITGIKVNGVDYTIKQGSGVEVTQDTTKKTTTITVDGTATTITDTDTTYTAGKGIAISDANAISVKLNKDEKNLVVDSNGLALNKNLTVDSVKAGDFFMDKNEGVGYKGKAYITSSGLNANGQTITNVKAGEAETDAVNVGQLNAVKAEASKKTTLSNGKNTTVTSVTTDGQTDYKVNVAGDLKDITSVANGASEIKLNADSIIIANTNKTFAITNSGIGMSYVASDYSTKAIMLGENGTTISGGLNVAGSKITGVADGTETKDAVNFGQLDATNKKVDNLTTEVGKGWTVATDNGTATKVGAGDTVKFSGADDNIKVSNDGKDVKVELNKKLTVDSVKAGDFFMDKNEGVGYKGKAYITSSGLNANGQTITNVKAGEAETDAVNVGQLNAVKAEASKKTTLSNGKNTTVTSVTTDGQTDYKVNVAGDLKDITSVANGASEIKLNADSIIIANTNKTFAITNSGIGMSYVASDYSTKAIMLGENGTTISGGLNVAGSKITGVAAGTAATDAVNVGQLNAVKETANKGWKLKTNNGNVSDVKPGDEVEFDGDDNIKVSNAGNKVSFKLNNKLTGIESIAGVGGSISFSGGNVTINNNVTFGSNGQIHNVTAGTASTDAVNVGQLNAAVQAGNTDTHIKPGEYGVGADNKVNMDVVDKTGTKINTVTITDVAKASDLGNVNNINNDLKNSNGTTTVVDAVNNLNQKLDNKVGDLQYSKVDKGDIADGDSTTTAIGKLDQKLNDVAATAAKQHTTVSGSGNIVVEDPTINADGGKNYNVKLADDINVNSVTANTFKADQTVMNKDGLKVGEKVSVTENAVTAGKTSISDDGVKVGDKTYISADGLNANDQKVTNVSDGKVEKDSKDAINGGQLHQAKADINNRIDGVENQVISNTNRINKLGSRVNKVGAGAAALAALHPMDFDPDDKLTFSAGYGNYAGENAAAIGAYYRPDEKVMFSVAGTVGNGENMVNAGVSFALDRTNHVSNSRTALAREVIDLRGQLAVMGAKMAKMEKAFGMLDETKTKLFPDVPANHWAYEYIAKLAGNGYIEGYPDGNFGGDRLMTRYEFAAMLYRAIENGAALEEKIIKEFEPELGRIRVDRISGEDGDRDKIERVRVNDTKGERDHYGNKLAK